MHREGIDGTLAARYRRQMQVTVNGEPHTVALVGAVSVEQLIVALGYPRDRVAVEHNGNLVLKAARAQTAVVDGDVFEIVTLVGGG